MTPAQRYQRAIDNGELMFDPAQADFVTALDRLYRTLCDDPKPMEGNWLTQLYRRFKPPPPMLVRGIYVWGSVGRGKTLLVDSFFETLPFENKLRIHFHDFMQQVHAQLKTLGERQDPLQWVAVDLSKRAKVLCFDEFHVSDIADAMILSRLLEVLFNQGVALIATSNSAPDNLYPDGLQRQRFLPAIDLIHQHTQVLHLDSAQDYRLRTLERAAVYHYPLNDENSQRMAQCFKELATDAALVEQTIDIAGRSISILGLAHGCVWFEFKDLCESARSAADFLELARRYHTVMVSNVPQMDSEKNDAALRFIHLVDNLYDHNVNLVLSAYGEPGDLYTGRRHSNAFRRTRSRLEEMQSREYLSRAHIS